MSLESEEGAAATIIDGGGGYYSGINIAVDGVVIGKPGKGFTLTRGGQGIGTFVVSDATIAGNHAVNNRFSGFSIGGTGHRITGNLSTNNGNSGFQVCCESFVVSSNVSVGSNVGFDIQGQHHVVSGNLATGSAYAGFGVNFGPHTFTGNSAIGNLGPGVWVAISYGTVITRNNIHGNDVTTNCGLVNATGGTLDAHGNFWGAASGPGDDPADEACDETSSHTTTSPVAARQFSVSVVNLQ